MSLVFRFAPGQRAGGPRSSRPPPALHPGPLGRLAVFLGGMLAASFAPAATYSAESAIDFAISAIHRDGIPVTAMPGDLSVSADLGGNFVAFSRGNAHAYGSAKLSYDGNELGVFGGAEDGEVDLPGIGRVTASVDVGFLTRDGITLGASFRQLVRAWGTADPPAQSIALSMVFVANNLRIANQSADSIYRVTIAGNARIRAEAAVAGSGEAAWAKAIRATLSPRVFDLEEQMEGMSNEERAEFIDSLPLRQRWEYVNSSAEVAASPGKSPRSENFAFEWKFDVAPGEERTAFFLLTATGVASVVPEPPILHALLGGIALLGIRAKQARRVHRT